MKMIQPTDGIDGIQKVQLQKVYKASSAGTVDRTSRSDAVTISKYSAMVEQGKAIAMSLPEIRADRISEVKASLETGDTPSTGDITSAMINCAAKSRSY
jgi:hypothetical protein